jgi:hypothetical protein
MHRQGAWSAQKWPDFAVDRQNPIKMPVFRLAGFLL